MKPMATVIKQGLVASMSEFHNHTSTVVHFQNLTLPQVSFSKNLLHLVVCYTSYFKALWDYLSSGINQHWS